MLCRLCVAVMICAVCVAGADGAEAKPIPVGAAKVDITPEFPVRMSGYSNRKYETTEISQRLFAKAIALGDEQPAVLVMVENCGMTAAIRDAVVAKLKDHGVRDERLVVTVTHSHTAPVLTNWAPYLFGEDIPEPHQKHIDEYTRQLTEKIVEVATAALKSRRPANLAWAVGKVGFAANRRVLKDGKWTGFGVQADGPVDHSLPVLKATEAGTGKLIALVANYACHCTTLGGNINQISGDWAGYAQEYIEQEQPGAVSA